MLVFYHRNLSQGKLSSILRLSQVYQNMVLKFNCYAMKHLKLGIFKHLQVFRSEVLAGLNWMFFFRSHRSTFMTSVPFLSKLMVD